MMRRIRNAGEVSICKENQSFKGSKEEKKRQDVVGQSRRGETKEMCKVKGRVRKERDDRKIKHEEMNSEGPRILNW